jgi:hypothetical protein
MALGGPQFELRVARGPNLQQRIVAPIVEFDAGDRLGVAAIEVLGETQNCRETPHHLPPLTSEFVEISMPPRWRRAPVVARRQRDRFDLVRFETAEIAVLDQVIRVTVVTLVADVDAGIVQNGRVLEPFALLVGHPVNGARAVEERQRKPRDLVRVIRPIAAALSEFDHTAPAHVRIPIGLRDLLPVFGDVIEDQTLAKRQVAQTDLVGVEPFQNGVEQDRAGNREVGTSRIEPRYLEPFFEIQRRQQFPHAVNLLGRHAPIPDGCGPFALACGNGSEAQDRAGSADDTIETGCGDLFEMFLELRFDVLDELSLVARRNRVALDESLGEPDHADFEAPSEIDGRAGTAGDFHAAAADVDHDADLAGQSKPVSGRKVNEPGLFRARQHPCAYACLCDDGVKKFATVFCLSNRARRAGDDVIDLMGSGQSAELGKHLQRQAHGFRRECLPIKAARAEPHHLLLAVDHLK